MVNEENKKAIEKVLEKELLGLVGGLVKSFVGDGGNLFEEKEGKTQKGEKVEEDLEKIYEQGLEVFKNLQKELRKDLNEQEDKLGKIVDVLMGGEDILIIGKNQVEKELLLKKIVLNAYKKGYAGEFCGVNDIDGVQGKELYENFVANDTQVVGLVDAVSVGEAMDKIIYNYPDVYENLFGLIVQVEDGKIKYLCYL